MARTTIITIIKKIECYGIFILFNVKTLISNNQFTNSGFFVSVSALKIKVIAGWHNLWNFRVA